MWQPIAVDNRGRMRNKDCTDCDVCSMRDDVIGAANLKAMQLRSRKYAG